MTTINDEIDGGGSTSTAHSIGFVDIFGFEIFATNSLEQLCINFANEKLQRLFIGVLFDAAAARYREEGVDVETIKYTDNIAVVELIAGRADSLMGALTEECIFPKGSDGSYAEKVKKVHSKHAHFNDMKTEPTAFAVRHFAGEVVYEVDGFLAKNKDPISQALHRHHHHHHHLQLHRTATTTTSRPRHRHRQPRRTCSCCCNTRETRGSHR